MNANEFNELYAIRTCLPLTKLGFIKSGVSLFLQRDSTYIALIRNNFRGERVARFLLCVRHSFTRDIKNDTYNLIESDPSSYPFRMKPLSLSELYLKTWHYNTYNYNDWDYDKIYYGISEANSNDIEEELSKLAYNIEKYYLTLINMFSPEKALNLIKKYNSSFQTEIDWIEDYSKYISQNMSDRKVINIFKKRQ